eukprot:1061819-Rhodomonas_salina.1
MTLATLAMTLCGSPRFISAIPLRISFIVTKPSWSLSHMRNTCRMLRDLVSIARWISAISSGFTSPATAHPPALSFARAPSRDLARTGCAVEHGSDEECGCGVHTAFQTLAGHRVHLSPHGVLRVRRALHQPPHLCTLFVAVVRKRSLDIVQVRVHHLGEFLACARCVSDLRAPRRARQTLRSASVCWGHYRHRDEPLVVGVEVVHQVVDGRVWDAHVHPLHCLVEVVLGTPAPARFSLSVMHCGTPAQQQHQVSDLGPRSGMEGLSSRG